MFTLVLKGHIALDQARFPEGTTGTQLDILARQFLWQQGYDYDHGTGHGVGCYLSVHEGPQRIAKPFNATALMAGMVLSNEPGYYKDGAYGLRCENLLVVTEVGDVADSGKKMLGFEPLTMAPFDRRLIEVDLLNDAELNWVNDYHENVFSNIGPLLEEETREWLRQATLPLARTSPLQ